MGVSDNYAMPVLVFAFTYSAFVILMLGFAGWSASTTDISFGEFSWASVVTGINILGIWNILLFTPVLIGISYAVIALAIPAWI